MTYLLKTSNDWTWTGWRGDAAVAICWWD